MIQRIQSLYLLLVTALMACTLFLPIVHVSTKHGELALQAFKPFGNEFYGETSAFGWLFAVMFILSTLLPLVTIFLFKYRKRQVGLCAAQGVLVVVLLFYWLIIPDILPADAVISKRLGWAFIMPIVALIPTFLAGRAIFRDEVLVRSLDRIR